MLKFIHINRKHMQSCLQNLSYEKNISCRGLKSLTLSTLRPRSIQMPVSYHRYTFVRNNTTENSNTFANENWTTIYRLRHIIFARVLCKLKIYQTSITVLSVPGLMLLQNWGMATMSQVQWTIYISIFASVMLFVVGNLAQKCVGIIYINESRDKVRIAHLTFWGNRRDLIVPSNDIVSFMDVSERPTEVFNKVLRYSDPKSTMYLSLKYGSIVDRKSFEHVFGTLDVN